MIKRIIASLSLLLCLCLTAMANKEVSIRLDDKNRIQNERLGFAYLTFEYLYPEGNKAIVRVTLENITSNPPHAVLIFRNDVSEQVLKKGKPKIEFEKTYPGKKGTRTVRGCRFSNSNIEIIPAAVTDTVFTIDVPLTSARNFSLPLYEAKYKAKDLYKKGKYNISYKIMEEHLYDIQLEVIGWSENDPTYVSIKNDVESLASSLKGKEFCHNSRHRPTLSEQQRPYQEKKDSLITAIKNIFDSHEEWMSTDAPHQAYSQLLTQLDNINLGNMTVDCGKHKAKGHNCNFCSLSAQDIYQRLDDLYQQLYAGKITKDAALKSANSLYNCYQQNKRRSKDNSYGTKITRFYNSISNY